MREIHSWDFYDRGFNITRVEPAVAPKGNVHLKQDAPVYEYKPKSKAQERKRKAAKLAKKARKNK